MKFVLPLAFAAAMVLSSVAFAEGAGAAAGADQAAPKAEDTAKPSKPAYNPDEVVCKTSQVTGSRLGGHRVCRTRGEWDQQTRQDQNTITNMQSRVHTAPGG
ncbi:MAG TPA: hypothetical protein VFE03_06280 [Caulobacteraceae bacterium]|jgi:hypothetical protein|nr:hypothetical protein [Caulobacteraceae bacterium]